MKKWTAFVDGAARGNPGPAGIGIHIEDEEGNIAREIGEPLGRTTNNVAEYSALLRALEEAVRLDIQHLTVYTDSELMAHQVNGKYAVKAAHLQPMHKRAHVLMSSIEKVSVVHVPREQNKRADALSNIGADKVI